MDGDWIQQYSGLFCVLNNEGEVLTWKLTKNLRFDSIEEQLKNLQQRLQSQGKVVTEFYIDNCGEINSKVYLDPTCFVRCVSCITNKMSKRHAFNSLCVHDLKMAFRDPTDTGKCRTKITPDEVTLHHNLKVFLSKWKSVECNGSQGFVTCCT